MKKEKKIVILNIYCVKNVFGVTFVKLYMTFCISVLLIIEISLLLLLSGWGEIGSALLNLISGDDYCFSRKPQVTWVTKSMNRVQFLDEITSIHFTQILTISKPQCLTGTCVCEKLSQPWFYNYFIYAGSSSKKCYCHS